MFRLMSFHSYNRITEYFITECSEEDDDETYPKIARFPVSVRYSRAEQEARAWEYLRYLNAQQEAVNTVKESVVLGDSSLEQSNLED